MLARVAAAVFALGTVGVLTSAFTFPALSSAESMATEAPVGAVSALESTCPLLGRQQTSQDCDRAAAPAVATGIDDDLADLIDAIVSKINALFLQAQAEIDQSAPATASQFGPEVDDLRDAIEQLAQSQINAPQTAPDPSLADATAALSEAIQDAAQSQVDKALAAPETSSTALGGGAPGCTTQQEAGVDWTRTSIRCVQQQVSSSSSTSSVQVSSSSSVSVSTQSSSDSR